MDLNIYIDLCLIDDYADKDLHDGYSLEVSSLPEPERITFVNMLFEKDPIFREMAYDRMQELIEKRMDMAEREDREEILGSSVRCHTNNEIIGYRRVG